MGGELQTNSELFLAGLIFSSVDEAILNYSCIIGLKNDYMC